MYSSLFYFFMAFYLQNVEISPIYIGLIIFSLLTIIYIGIKQRVYLSVELVMALGLVSYFLFEQLLIKGDIATFIEVVVSFICFIVALQVFSLNLENYDQMKTMIFWFMRLTLVLFTIEATIRLLHPDYSAYNALLNQGDSFYMYKSNSILFQDSNFVGTELLIIFFTALYFLKKFKLPLTKYLICFFVLILLTFSRAIWVAVLIGLYLFGFKYNIKKVFLTLFFVFISFVSYEMFIVNDASFQSKWEIIDKFIEFFKNSNVETKLFGVGFGNTFNYLGIGAHNIVVSFVMDSGLVGFILFVLFLSVIMLKYRKTMIVLIPFLISGMSLAGNAQSLLYTSLALIIVAESQNFNENKS